MEPQLNQIVEDVVATHDNYALQALLSELDASGSLEKVTTWLETSSDPSFAESCTTFRN